MADTNQTGGNGSTPPNDTEFTAGTDVGGDTQVEFAAADVPMDDDDTLAGGSGAASGSGNRNGGSGAAGGSGMSGDEATTTGEKIKAGAQKLVDTAGDKARTYAEDGKAKGADVLAGLSGMINNAAGDVDSQLGEQYGQYARSAADAVNGFSEKLRDADIDDIVDDVREFVTKSPAVAIGAAAAIGFVLVRLIRSGLDADASA